MQKFAVAFGFLFIACSAQYQHRAVLENDAFENLIPSHYRNPLLKTPRFLHALAKSTWFGPGEQPVIVVYIGCCGNNSLHEGAYRHVMDNFRMGLVFNREADKIHRSEIYTVLTHAGFIDRQIGKFQ